jgi:glucosyl-dolichyl phosphate glucuronosyltransferase
MDVAVVISTYSIERAKDIDACLLSLKKQSLPPKEVILVLDPNEALFSFYKKRLKSQVQFVVSDAFGLSAARNAGIKNSQSEFVAFIDDDAVADVEWLNHLVKNFEDSAVVGVGGKIVPVWPQKEPNWFPQEIYWILGCSYKGLPGVKAQIRNPIGCNMIFRRNLFTQVGLFSTNFGRVGNQLLGHEDTEFGMRVANLLPSLKIIYDPLAIVYHKVSNNRVSLRYVVKRSYSEGLSKAFIANIKTNTATMSTERDYLKKVLQNTPHLRISQAITLYFSTITVLIGYLDSLIRSRIVLMHTKIRCYYTKHS